MKTSKMTQDQKNFIIEAGKAGHKAYEIYKELFTLGKVNFGVTRVYQILNQNNIEYVARKTKYLDQNLVSRLKEIVEKIKVENVFYSRGKIAQMLGIDHQTLNKIAKLNNIELQDFSVFRDQRKAEIRAKKLEEAAKKPKIFNNNLSAFSNIGKYLKVELKDKPNFEFTSTSMHEILKAKYPDKMEKVTKNYLNLVIIRFFEQGYLTREVSNKKFFYIYTYIKDFETNEVFLPTPKQQQPLKLKTDKIKKSLGGGISGDEFTQFGFCNFRKKNLECVNEGILYKTKIIKIIEIGNSSIEDEVDRFLCKNCLEKVEAGFL